MEFLTWGLIFKLMFLICASFHVYYLKVGSSSEDVARLQLTMFYSIFFMIAALIHFLKFGN